MANKPKNRDKARAAARNAKAAGRAGLPPTMAAQNQALLKKAKGNDY